MKALVPAAGNGSRLTAITAKQNKCLLECGGRPIIDLVVHAAAQIAEIDEIVVVVGYRADDVIRHFRENPLGKELRFVHQVEQRGLVDAIESARSFVADEDVLLMLGDEVLAGARYRQFIDDFHLRGFRASIGAFSTTDLARISKTYTFSHDGRRVRKIVEKPDVPLSPRMGTGSVLFAAGALEYIDFTEPHPGRGEKDLAGVLQVMIDQGQPVGWYEVCDGFSNVNTREDLLHAYELMGSITSRLDGVD